MAKLKTTMDAAFWNLNVATPLTLDGVCRSIPGEPVPLDGTRPGWAFRTQQLRILKKGFPLGLVPGYHDPPLDKELGAYTLQSSLALPVNNRWWLGLIGQIRPRKIIAGIKSEILKIDWEKSPFIVATNLATILATDCGKYFLDKSLLSSIGLCSRLALSKSGFLHLSTENNLETKERRSKAYLIQKIPKHVIIFEAAWPELFIDHNGKYWNVPESISLDCSSDPLKCGLQYRFGIHKNGGVPEADGIVDGGPPLSLMPGLCAKAAISFDHSLKWKFDMKTEDEQLADVVCRRRPYDVLLSESHAAISGLIGANCAAWFGGMENPVESTDNGNTIHMDAKRRSPFTAHTFGSICATYQHGEFMKLFGDLTRVDARLDIATGLAKNIFRKKSVDNSGTQLASPRLSLIFQQQLLGPYSFRVDSRFLLSDPHVEDVVYSLNYAVKRLKSGRVVAWYSPKRKEGMVELRVSEF